MRSTGALALATSLAVGWGFAPVAAASTVTLGFDDVANPKNTSVPVSGAYLGFTLSGDKDPQAETYGYYNGAFTNTLTALSSPCPPCGVAPQHLNNLRGQITVESAVPFQLVDFYLASFRINNMAGTGSGSTHVRVQGFQAGNATAVATFHAPLDIAGTVHPDMQRFDPAGDATGVNGDSGSWDLFLVKLVFSPVTRTDIAGFGPVYSVATTSFLLDNLQVRPVPLPAGAFLLASAIGVLGVSRRRRVADRPAASG